ncbi:putative acetyltransferase [Actinoplanes sp. SE50]|uniref:GNAT family N-acetyltransferase n=1 Tax=unclassified Actinoplanes TaxID=2626549 RepID=UPI00023ED18C|nr:MULTISPECIES: GNAT family N-acetyltransferase [unclassified Actinoplanes]AEV81648.1 putative acetyltransferase [Actinoplanes sp. SE50/110]ATO80049.1 putative acetyltransferase [Actinoplanes sp. SE50]SLL97453.1 acetyltransferase [Actinoplanes sp. SE50/110]
MTWEIRSDLDRFAAVAGDFLRASPVRHTVFLTLIDNLRSRGLHAYGAGDPVFGWWITPGDDSVSGVLLQTPPHPVMFTALPAPAVPAAAAALRSRPLPGVNMLVDDLPAFVGSRAHQPGMRTRLHPLGTLTPPSPPGAARPAGPADRDLVTAWLTDFFAVTGEPRADVAAVVDELLPRVTLRVDDATPVSMAVRSRPAAGMIRILYVWTPPALRRHGYAAGATAAATRAALDEGAAEVVLYTDLDNPTSNALYHRLGYRPVEDRAVVTFA